MYQQTLTLLNYTTATALLYYSVKYWGNITWQVGPQTRYVAHSTDSDRIIPVKFTEIKQAGLNCSSSYESSKQQQKRPD